MSTPSLVIPDFFPTQFGTSWTHLLQQEESRLKETVSLDSDIRGKEKSYNQKGLATMRKITTRNGKTIASTTADEKRWIRTEAYDEVTHFDEWDQDLLGEIALPTSETVQAHAMAAGRTMDQVVIDAASGTAYTGETGVTATSFLAANQIAVNYGGANSGLTLAKLIKAKSILGINESYGQNGNKNDKLVLIVTQKQLDDLLTVTEVTNSDYAAVKALQSGEIHEFMGFMFKRTQLLTLNSSTDVRTCLAYVQSGIKLGITTERSVKTVIRDDLNETLQIRTKIRLGATRTMEEKVVEIACDESP
jgi:hypothetical protein